MRADLAEAAGVRESSEQPSVGPAVHGRRGRPPIHVRADFRDTLPPLFREIGQVYALRVTSKRLREISLLMLVVPAGIGSLVGTLAHIEWLQRTGVILLLIVGAVALTDWMRASAG